MDYIKYQERYINKSRMLASKYLQKLEELPGEPKELEYFKSILRKVFIDNEVVKYNNNEKFIGTFCEVMPFEIIAAAGARPLKLCSNNFVGYTIGDYETPGYVCSLVKSVLGNFSGELCENYNICDMYVVPASCDCKKKLAEKLSSLKPTVPLYIPLNRADDNGIDMFVQELKDTAQKISNITGKTITRESLLTQIRKYSDVQKDIQTFLNLKQNNECIIRGTHAMVVMNTMAYDDISNWHEHLKLLNKELIEKKNNNLFLAKKKLPRILIAGSPITFPNIKIPLIIEEQGGIVISDETCLGDRMSNDFISISSDTLDGYYRALANRAIKPCACSFFNESVPYINKIDKIVERSSVDGIVYHVIRGCLSNDYEFAQIEKHFTKKGIPVLRIESDLSEEDVEILNVRLEAFIEMLKYKKLNGENF